MGARSLATREHSWLMTSTGSRKSIDESGLIGGDGRITGAENTSSTVRLPV